MQTTLIPTHTFRRSISDQELVAYLARAARELRTGALLARDYDAWRRRCPDPVRPPTASMISRRLGGWHSALRAAGLTRPRQSRRPALSNRRLLATLRRVAARVEGPLTMDAFRAHAGRSQGCPDTYIARFGSWSQALERAGLAERIARVRARSERDLDASLEALEALGPDASRADWARVRRECGEPLLGAETLIGRYGSWEAARRAAASAFTAL